METSSYLAMLARMLANGGYRVAESDTEDLHELLELRRVLDEAILDAVRGLRESGVTWAQIGEAAGTTGQAATMRWGHDL